MSKFIALVVAANACGAVALAVVLSMASPDATPARPPLHGDFASLLQPKLDGIGNTRDLVPVSFGGGGAGPVRKKQAGP